jgi:pimeloyl-[acyl-carrier protein] methyl ester esterase
LYEEGKRMKLIVVSGWATPLEALTGFIRTASQLFEVQPYALTDLYGDVSKSPVIFGGDGPSVWASSLIEKLEKVSEPFWLSGFSMGGMIALEAAVRKPEKIQGLILAGTSPSFCFREDFDHGKPAENVRALSLNLFKNPRQALSRFYELVSHPFRPFKEKEEAWLDAVLKTDVKVLEKGLQYLMNTDLRNLFPKISMPVFLVHGKQDKVVPWQASEWMSKNLAKSKLKLLDDYGHDLILRYSSWLPDELNDFIGVHP